MIIDIFTSFDYIALLMEINQNIKMLSPFQNWIVSSLLLICEMNALKSSSEEMRI